MQFMRMHFILPVHFNNVCLWKGGTLNAFYWLLMSHWPRCFLAAPSFGTASDNFYVAWISDQMNPGAIPASKIEVHLQKLFALKNTDDS